MAFLKKGLPNLSIAGKPIWEHFWLNNLWFHQPRPILKVLMILDYLWFHWPHHGNKYSELIATDRGQWWRWGGGVFSYFVSWSSTGRLMSAWLSLPALLCTAILALLVSVMDELSFNVCQIINKYYYNYYSLLCNKPKTSRNSQIYIKSIPNNRHQAEALPYKMMLP